MRFETRVPSSGSSRRSHRRPLLRVLPIAALPLATLSLPAALLGLPGDTAAQERLPIDGAVSRYERALRSLEGRASADPAGAAGEAGRLRRRLITESGGVAYSHDRARIERRLGEIQAQAGAEAVAAGQPEPPRFHDLNEPLPRSYAEEPGDLPSIQRELRLVSRLLDRADAGLGDGDAESVDSDIATAVTNLTSLAPAVPEAELKPIQARIEGLRQRLAALPPDAAEKAAAANAGTLQRPGIPPAGTTGD